MIWPQCKKTWWTLNLTKMVLGYLLGSLLDLTVYGSHIVSTKSPSPYTGIPCIIACFPNDYRIIILIVQITM